MKQIYIGGDSFCYYRGTHDWPFLVAESLNLQLQGQGFPGDSWWHTRKHLLTYLNTPQAAETDIFILCHTDPFRPLTGEKFFKNPEAEKVKEQYFKYFVDYEVSLWATKQWYEELNFLLQNRKVLHFQSFGSSKDIFKFLNGTRISTPLVELSLGQNNQQDFMNDTRRNHFDQDHNKKFAKLVVECLNSVQQDSEISF